MSELARRIGYSDHNMVSRFLKGEKTLQLDRVEAWAKACGQHLVLVPDQPAASDLPLIVGTLNHDDQVLVTRIARVLGRLPDPARRTLEHLIGAWEAEYGGAPENP